MCAGLYDRAVHLVLDTALLPRLAQGDCSSSVAALKYLEYITVALAMCGSDRVQVLLARLPDTLINLQDPILILRGACSASRQD